LDGRRRAARPCHRSLASGSDVFATPDLVAVDGDHAVATFAAMSGERFELLAVSLEVL